MRPELFSPLFDVAGPPVLAIVGAGLGLGLLWFAAVVLIEATVLTVMRWERFRSALMSSLVMNGVSTIVGILLVGTLLGLPPQIMLLAAFVASVLLEWAVLNGRQRKQRRRAFYVSLVANLITYAPLSLILFPFF